MSDEELTIESYVEQLRTELPDVLPCSDEDMDWGWVDTALELLEEGEFLLAERKFQELILARPDDMDGYEGLALVYGQLGRRREAALLIGHAIDLARRDVARDLIDPDVLDQLFAEEREILALPETAEAGGEPAAV
jgi:tetratricopeptide (TPR) repeat protein